MSIGLKGNVDGSGAIQVGGSDAITISTGLDATFAGEVTAGAITSSGVVTGSTGALYPLVIGTAVAASSQTSITFTGIPSTARRVTISFSGISTSGTSNYQIRIGTSAGITNTGYASVATRVSGGAAGQASSTAGILISSSVAAAAISGVVVFTHMGSNVWAATGTAGDITAAVVGFSTSGAKTLPGVLDRIALTTVNGTDTFDDGVVNILYE